MFKHAPKQVDRPVIGQEPTWNGLTSENPQGEADIQYHELAAVERAVNELPVNESPWTWPIYGGPNELDGETHVGEHARSGPEGQTLRPAPGRQDGSVSSPVSPLVYAPDFMRTSPRPIANSMMDVQAYARVWPTSTVSTDAIRVDHRIIHQQHQSTVYLQEPCLVDIGTEAEIFELDTGHYATQGDQLRCSANSSVSSWCRFPETRLLQEFPAEIDNGDTIYVPVRGPAQLGQQKGYFEGRRRAEQALKLEESVMRVLNDDGEQPVLWESSAIQGPLIGMVEAIAQQLQPQGAKVLRMLEDGAERVTKRFDDALRYQWNKKGNLSKKDLPFFLRGWLSPTERMRNPVSEYRNSAIRQNDAESVCSDAFDQLGDENNLLYHKLRLADVLDKSTDEDDPQGRIDSSVVPTIGPNHVSQYEAEDSPSSEWRTSNHHSPPIMNR